MARRFGYSRVSTSDQDWSLQLEALTKAGVDDRDIFREKASGPPWLSRLGTPLKAPSLLLNRPTNPIPAPLRYQTARK
jgi:Resolvase, N terminal domain